MHYAACPDFGKDGGDCRGCVPREAADGALICSRCISRLKSAIADAPDLMARIRSEADPLKAAVYDRELVSGGNPAHAPAPVSADLLDAGDAIMTTLWATALLITWGQAPLGRYVVQPHASSEGVHAMAEEWAEIILADLPNFANRLEVVPFASAVLDRPEDPDGWSISKALSRWPVEDRSYWAAQPCPADLGGCGLRAVKVTPPKSQHAQAGYRCEKCGWHPRSDLGRARAALVFSRAAGGVTEERATWIRREDAPRVTGKDKRTIYRWEQQGLLVFIGEGRDAICTEDALLEAARTANQRVGRPRATKEAA
jgi:hypothetical protein